MSLISKLKQKRARRTARVRSQLKTNSELPRVSVFRSARHIYGQLIDDMTGNTLVSFSSLQLEKPNGDKKEVAKQVGVELGKLVLAKKINSARFDRGRFLYHGRVKALADGLREAGLNI